MSLEKKINLNTESWEEKKKEIDRRVSYLENNCLSKSDYYGLLERIKILENSKDIKEVLDKNVLIRKLENRSSLVLNTLPEFKYALEILDIDTDLQREVLAHENSHINKAEELNAQMTNYTIGFLRMKKMN